MYGSGSVGSGTSASPSCTQGRSHVREFRLHGFGRGALAASCPHGPKADLEAGDNKIFALSDQRPSAGAWSFFTATRRGVCNLFSSGGGPKGRYRKNSGPDPRGVGMACAFNPSAMASSDVAPASLMMADTEYAPCSVSVAHDQGPHRARSGAGRPRRIKIHAILESRNCGGLLCESARNRKKI